MPPTCTTLVRRARRARFCAGVCPRSSSSASGGGALLAPPRPSERCDAREPCFDGICTAAGRPARMRQCGRMQVLVTSNAWWEEIFCCCLPGKAHREMG
jgi:hypothetical protein